MLLCSLMMESLNDAFEVRMDPRRVCADTVSGNVSITFGEEEAELTAEELWEQVINISLVI